MTTIILPPDLEDRLAAEARKRGTTAELLALDSLRRLFVPPPTGPTEGAETLYDLLAGFIGTVNGTTEALSENCGQHFAEGLADQHQPGRS